MNRDEYHIIGQIQHGGWVEGGDSANWMGHKLSMTEDEYWSVEKYIDEFEIDHGVWVRHPYKKEKSFSDFYNGVYDGNISRDQLTGILFCLSTHRKYRALLSIVKTQAMRGFIFANNTVQNGIDPWKDMRANPGPLYFIKCMFGLVKNRKFPDLVFTDVWAMIIRGFYPYSFMLYPVLCIFDLHILINAVVVRFQSVEKSDDVLSHLAKMITSARIMPTPFSWLACRISNSEKLVKKLTKYWCGWRGNCGFVPVYKELIDLYIR